jgi:hypothetical protein
MVRGMIMLSGIETLDMLWLWIVSFLKLFRSGFILLEGGYCFRPLGRLPLKSWWAELWFI